MAVNFTPYPGIAPCKSAYDAELVELRKRLGLSHKLMGDDIQQLTKHPEFIYPHGFYRHDYERIFRDIAGGEDHDREARAKGAQRMLILNDLFYILVWVMGIEKANHPFIVSQCRMMEEGPQSDTLDIWARFHFKSTIITIAETLQYHLKYPEECTGILGYARPVAKKFLRAIKNLCEQSLLLKWAFDDVLWQNPMSEAPKWSLDVNTPILTTKGWKRHGDLQYGDQIFGSKGQVINVIGNSGPMENAECRKIVFDDCEMVASSEHLWPVQCKPSTSGAWPEEPAIKIVETDGLPIRNRQERLLPTPVVDTPQQKSPPIIDPYILGLWLGDGTAGTNIISTHRDDEKEVLDQITNAGLAYYIHRRKPEDNFSMYGVRGLKESLTVVGCLKKKHIPERYMFGSAHERLALLQGLMDSDGTCKHLSNCAGMCMFSNINEDLARGVFHLAASLGLRPSIVSHMPKQRGRYRIYQVYFIGLKSIPPFRSQRKLDKCKEKRHKVGRYVKSIEEIPSVTVNCIKVDAPDSLYLAGKSLVVTHNSEDDGIVFKRKSASRGESTVEAWGLTEGAPTGRHFERLIFDDIETEDIAGSAKMMSDVFSKFQMNVFNLGTGSDKDKRRVIGTYYSHVGPIKQVESMKFEDTRDATGVIAGKPMWTLRICPATDDGTINGKPVMLDPDSWNRIKCTKHVNSQQLCNPTPSTDILLDKSMLNRIDPAFLRTGKWADRFKFMCIDQAGGTDTNISGPGDLWAIMVISIVPSAALASRNGTEATDDDLGISDVCIEDCVADQMTHSMAVDTITRMYLKHGMIMQLGVEKVGLSTTEVHIADALAAKGRKLSVQHGNLVLLRPAGRKLENRISSALEWPLNNGKLYYSSGIDPVYIEKMKQEMDQFGFGHSDILNTAAYAYDMFKDFPFHRYAKRKVVSVTSLMAAGSAGGRVKGEWG